MTNSKNTMFVAFELPHERTLLTVLAGLPADPAMRGAALTALGRCQSSIIEALKSSDEAQSRRELRVLYEGLSLANEFICQIEPSAD